MENEECKFFKKLLNALECENIGLINLLLKSGCIGCNDWIEDSGVTIVHLAAGHGTESFASSLIQLLLENGADPNVPSLDQVTPVHVAAAWGRLHVLHILLVNGGDPWLQDDERRNAFNYAFEAKAWSAVELLHNFHLVTAERTKLTDVIFDHIDGPCENSKQVSQQEELNKTYFIESCPEESSPIPHTYRSTTEIFPVKRKDIIIETPSNIHFNIHSITENSVNSSQFNVLQEDNRDDHLSKLIERTFTVVAPEANEVSQNNLFTELFAAVKRRSERLSKIYSQGKHEDTEKIQESTSNKTISKLHAEERHEDTKKELENPVNTKFSSGIIQFKTSEYIDLVAQVKTEETNSYPELKLTEPAQCFPSDIIGDPVTLLLVEKNEEELRVVDISDSASSFLSLTDPSESSASSEAYESCSSPPNSKSNREGDEADRIRAELRTFGVNAGPITDTTKSVYLRILNRLQGQGIRVTPPATASAPFTENTSYISNYCSELEKAIINPMVLAEYAQLEIAVRKDFDAPGQTWRGGSSKTSFNYLLLDSRKTKNLPQRALNMPDPSEVTREFLNAVFYIGKGQSNRPYAHLQRAFQSWQHRFHPKDPKEAEILDIWRSGSGVVCLLIFHNTIPAEAFTREAAMIEALGRQHIRNLRSGEYYGRAAHWSDQERRKLGAYLLLTSKDILLRDGERVLRPCDL